MFTYRIVLDAYNSRASVPGARVVTYSRGCDRADAMRRLGSVRISSAGTVSDGVNTWPGTNNMPRGSVTVERSLPEWEVVSVRSVRTAGTARILADGVL